MLHIHRIQIHCVAKPLLTSLKVSLRPAKILDIYLYPPIYTVFLISPMALTNWLGPKPLALY